MTEDKNNIRTNMINNMRREKKKNNDIGRHNKLGEHLENREMHIK